MAQCVLLLGVSGHLRLSEVSFLVRRGVGGVQAAASACSGRELHTAAQRQDITASASASSSSTRIVAQQQICAMRPYSSQGGPLLRKLLVANRGEIACRVLQTARKLGIPTVAVYSDADRGAKHAQLADEAFRIGGAPARDSYLRGDVILDVARRTGSTAVHPGYGFLSENAPFAEQCAQAGVAFVGPPASAIRAMGDKSRAKAMMHDAGVPVVPGYHGADQDEPRLLAEAGRMGFPLLVKAVSGGGGKGMKLAYAEDQVVEAIRSARREAMASFSDDRLLLERYITRPRHVEVQVFADAHGNAVYLFDRDCSLQRRHQKVIEEAPAPGLSEEFHRHIGEAAVRAARAVGYANAGTVEFIVDTDSPGSKDFFFMEMNTRLQVEHPVSEAITGQDLVEWQLRVAAGLPLPMSQEQLTVSGHAFEARLYAEQPRNNFLPGAGRVRRWRVPTGACAFSLGPLRVDSGVREGDEVGTFYDPMIAKVVVHGPDRATALAALDKALADTQVAGLPTNVPFLRRLCQHPAFQSAQQLDTSFIPTHSQQLLAPQPLPQQVAALAAVARYLLAVRRQAEADASLPSPPAGPWALGDSKRLWHSHSTTYALHHPDGAPVSVSGGGGEGPEAAGGDVRLEVVVEDKTAFQVRLLDQHAAPSTPKGGKGGKAHAAPAAAAPATAVAVRAARLDGDDVLVAEVNGQLCTAHLLQYSHSPAEEALHLWVRGGEHYELRWQVPKWSKAAGAAAAGGGAGGSVTSPMPGRVISVAVQPGEQVAAGAPVVVIEAMKMEHAVKAPVEGVVQDVLVSSGAQVAQGQVLVVISSSSNSDGGGGGGGAAGAAAAKAQAEAPAAVPSGNPLVDVGP